MNKCANVMVNMMTIMHFLLLIMGTPGPRPRRTVGFEAAQLKGQVLQCHLHPARRRQSYIGFPQ